MNKVNNKIAQSIWFDLFGVALVVVAGIASGYLTESLHDLPLFSHTSWAVFVPFGLISIISSICSLMSTRLTGRLKRWGNYLGIFNVVLAGVIDFCLGNAASWITYPVSFVIYTFAINKWAKIKENEVAKPRSKKQITLIITGLSTASFAFSFFVNWLGWGFDKSALNGSQALLFWLITIGFAFSLVANILNAMKLTVQWNVWLFYNFINLMKAIAQGNAANVGKYIYYIINAIACHTFWKASPKEDTTNVTKLATKKLA